MRHLSLTAGLIVTSLLAMPAQAQWKDTSAGGACGVITTIDMQPQIPSMGFGFFSEKRNEFQFLIKGYMNVATPPPQKGSIVFADRTSPSVPAQFNHIPDPAGNLHTITITLASDYLVDVAKSPSFKVMLDGEDFATYALSGRGEAVITLASCMKKMKK